MSTYLQIEQSTGVGTEEEPKLMNKTSKRWFMLTMLCVYRMGCYYCMDELNSVKGETEQNLDITSEQFGWLLSMMAVVSVFAAPTAGFIMDKFGLITGVYLSASLILLGQISMTLAAYISSYPAMMCGRFIFGLGFEPINSVKGIITAKWFCGGELSLAANLNLSIARIFVFLSGYITPLVVE